MVSLRKWPNGDFMEVGHLTQVQLVIIKRWPTKDDFYMEEDLHHMNWAFTVLYLSTLTYYNIWPFSLDNKIHLLRPRPLNRGVHYNGDHIYVASQSISTTISGLLLWGVIECKSILDNAQSPKTILCAQYSPPVRQFWLILKAIF